MREAQRRYRVLPPLFGGSDKQRERIESELTSTHYWTGPRKRLGGRAMLVAASAGLLIAGAGGISAALVATNGGPPAAAPATSRAATSTTTAARSSTVATTRTTATTTAATTKTTTASSTKSTTTTKQSPATSPTPTRTHSATTAPVVTPPKTTTAVPVEPATTAEIDLVAPTVTIVTRPPSETTSSAASFSFRAGEAGATFACRLDGDAFEDCSSPAAYRALAPGVHRFVVRARDAAGNTGAAIATWTVLPPPDTTPPTVTIVSAVATGSDITFEFTSSEPGSTFACSLDGGAFETCASPRAYSALAPGPHTLAVHATDAAGNTGNAATHSWTVARPLPDLVVSALGESGFTVTNAGTAAAGPFVVTVTLIGTFSFSGLAPGQSTARTWSACRVGTLLAVADRGRAVTESNEDNNTRSVVSDC
jgi:hypothetical protein